VGALPGASLTRAAEGSCEASGRRVEIRREGLTEWYVNGESGIEQGFVIAAAPGPSGTGGPLRLVLSVEGGFAAEVLAGERDAWLVAVDGGVKLSYSGLRAWDAEGRELEARLTRTAERLAILVDDREASYPLTVDPWIWVEEAELEASDAGIGDSFGISVSLSGDRALVGAYGDNGDRGSAFVFVQVPPPVTYCTAKVNSMGCLPAIGCVGAPTISGPDDFHVTAASVLNNEVGMVFWGHGPNNLPFMGGTLCVAPPIIRTPVQHSGGNPPPPDCSGSYSFHFSQAYMASKFIVGGTQLYAQYWSRDPGFMPPNNVGLTADLDFIVGL